MITFRLISKQVIALLGFFKVEAIGVKAVQFRASACVLSSISKFSFLISKYVHRAIFFFFFF